MKLAIFKRNSNTARERAVRTLAAEASSAAPHLEAQAERSHAEIMVIISALMLAMLLAALDQTIVSTALPRIASDLHGLSKYSWVATAYLLTSAVSTPLYGKISDMFGRKKIFQTAIVIFLVGSALCGAAQTMNQLIVFRGSAGYRRRRPDDAGIRHHRRHRATAAAWPLSGLFWRRLRGFQRHRPTARAASSDRSPSSLALDVLYQPAYWRTGPSGYRCPAAPAGQSSPHKVDYAGAALLAVSVVSLLLATVWGGVDYPWGSAQIIGLFAASRR